MLVLSDSLNHAFTTPCCQFNGNKLLLLQIWAGSSSSFKEKSVGGRSEICTTRNLLKQTGGISDTEKQLVRGSLQLETCAVHLFDNIWHCSQDSLCLSFPLFFPWNSWQVEKGCPGTPRHFLIIFSYYFY